jgi:anthranilate synthase/aminodeoxychorismate synthase-like glutamine amidotransferase
MILLIDNYDSFTFNLFQYLGELGAETRVVRNDALTVSGIRDLAPRGIVISPGPGTPKDAGVSLELLRAGLGVPVLGVCLGHQAIGEAFGGEVVRAHPMHGKTSEVLHDGKTLFAGLGSPFVATRYHSLIVRKETLPTCLEVSAWTGDGTIMGLRHRDLPIEGVQFHPESFLTAVGKDILRNYLRLLGAK